LKKFWPSFGILLLLAVFITFNKMNQKFGVNFFSKNFVERYNPKNYEIVDKNFTVTSLKRYFLEKNIIDLATINRTQKW
jgi:hypothetical protein